MRVNMLKMSAKIKVTPFLLTLSALLSTRALAQDPEMNWALDSSSYKIIEHWPEDHPNHPNFSSSTSAAANKLATADTRTGCHLDCDFYRDRVNFEDSTSPILPNIPAGHFSIVFDYDYTLINGFSSMILRVFSQLGTSQWSLEQHHDFKMNSSDLAPYKDADKVPSWQFARLELPPYEIGVHLGNYGKSMHLWSGYKWDNLWVSHGFGKGKVNVADDERCIVYGRWKSKARCVLEMQKDEDCPWNRGVEPGMENAIGQGDGDE